MSTPLRIISNVPGITFDSLKTDVIFAEDMNSIKDHITDLENGESADGDVKFGGNTLGAKKVIGSVDNQDIGFVTNNTERITVLKSGYVGIGTTSPANRLQVVSGNSLSTTNIGTFYAGNLTQGIAIGYQDIHQIGSTAPLNINASTSGAVNIGNVSFGNILLANAGGYVGIGTTSPTAKLHLAAGTATANTAPLKFTAGVLNTVAVIGAVEFVDNGTDGHLYITLNVGGVLTRKEIAFV